MLLLQALSLRSSTCLFCFYVHRRDEPVPTNTIYLDTPAVDSGALVSAELLVADVIAIKTNQAIHQHTLGPDPDTGSPH